MQNGLIIIDTYTCDNAKMSHYKNIKFFCSKWEEKELVQMDDEEQGNLTRRHLYHAFDVLLCLVWVETRFGIQEQYTGYVTCSIAGK